MRGQARPRRKSVEGLCASTLLGVLHTRTWLLDAQLVYLLERTQAGPAPPPRAQSLCSFSRTSSADGWNEETIDLQSASLDPLHNFTGQGGSIDSDCAFDGDYAVPPLSMAEGLQHIRMMEGASRSLPSSPLLTHQTSSSGPPSVRKVFGQDTGCASLIFLLKLEQMHLTAAECS
ncbi:Protein TANC2 [Labeo rohita]|uniref:Protein TANC2 n=2 Tax=Labeo rohita TaxID=84645 RepID=A0ABQ8M7L5_LABRO|nr:Protein TANC2 [Labeo rohita]